MRSEKPQSDPDAYLSKIGVDGGLLPSQLMQSDLLQFTPERRIAYKLAILNLMDCVQGTQKNKLNSIAEIRCWIEDSDQWFEYSFDYWCEILGRNADSMRAKMRAFLDNAEEHAIMESAVKTINGHPMHAPHRGGTWICQKCGVKSQKVARVKECIDDKPIFSFEVEEADVREAALQGDCQGSPGSE